MYHLPFGRSRLFDLSEKVTAHSLVEEKEEEEVFGCLPLESHVVNYGDFGELGATDVTAGFGMG
jgi:hypothetical protein